MICRRLPAVVLLAAIALVAFAGVPASAAENATWGITESAPVRAGVDGAATPGGYLVFAGCAVRPAPGSPLATRGGGLADAAGFGPPQRSLFHLDGPGRFDMPFHQAQAAVDDAVGVIRQTIDEPIVARFVADLEQPASVLFRPTRASAGDGYRVMLRKWVERYGDAQHVIEWGPNLVRGRYADPFSIILHEGAEIAIRTGHSRLPLSSHFLRESLVDYTAVRLFGGQLGPQGRRRLLINAAVRLLPSR